MRKITLLLLSFLFVSFLYSQETTNPKAKISSVSFRQGVILAVPANTIDDYNSLMTVSSAPGSIFINPSLYQSNTYDAPSGNYSMRVDIAITPYSKKKGKYRLNRELRFSIGSDAGIRRNFMFYKNRSGGSDTLFSSDGNPVIKVDTTMYEQYNYAENYVSLTVGFSYLFKTDPARRVQLYTGFGFEYGIAIRGQLRTYHEADTTMHSSQIGSSGGEYYSNMGSSRYNNFGRNSRNVDYKMKGTTHFLRGNIPLGINFRFSNNNRFFKHINIFSELQPGVELQITNGETLVNPYFGIVILGLSYKW